MVVPDCSILSIFFVFRVVAPGDGGACPGFKRPTLWWTRGAALQLLGGKEMRKMRMKLGNHGTPWREGHAVGEGWAVRSLDCVCVCRPNGQGVPGLLPEAVIN